MSSLLEGLPAGLDSRPLSPADSRAVYAVIAAQELLDVGEVVIEEADIIGDWQRPSFDLAASSIGVLDGDDLVAYAEVTGSFFGDAAVLPAYRGRGIGTALARWMQATSRARGMEVIGMPVPEGGVSDRLLEELGYVVRWQSWVLTLPEGRQIEAQPLPAGHVIRDAESDEDRRAAWTVVEDAFLEWAERERQSFEDFSARTVLRPGFEPWNLRIVVDPEGEVVGSCLLQLDATCGYVSMLAVRRDRRGEGLARGLLADAFANARAHGATRSELSTDSRTGALGLYERVGMVVASTWVHRAVWL